jgi:hypothetical protein
MKESTIMLEIRKGPADWTKHHIEDVQDIRPRVPSR